MRHAPRPHASLAAVRAPAAGLVAGVVALSAAFAAATLAGALPVPPAIQAMWEAPDGAAVRKALRAAIAEGSTPTADARKRLEAGEAAYWLGVQDANAGRPDSALAQWRRAMALRGDFDEGFSLIDALCRRGRKADLTEAYLVAGPLAEQARFGMPQRSPESHARLAWVLHLQGRSDTAYAVIQEHCANVQARPLWTRRFVQVQLAAGDAATAWRWTCVLSARTRGRDAATESLVVRTQRTLRRDDEERSTFTSVVRDRIEAGESALLAAPGARPGTLKVKDGTTVRWFEIPATEGVPPRPPVLFVLAPGDTLTAPDTLAAALAHAGHPVALLVPRGCHGAVGPGVTGPESWAGREAEWHTAVAGDAARVMEQLAKSGVASGPWLVGAGGSMAPVALALARGRGKPEALILTAPRLPLVEVAEFRARLRDAGTRAFIQVGPEEPEAMEVADLIARSTRPGQVRVADSGRAGKGAALFRGEPKVGARLIAWLEEKPAPR